MMKRMHSAGIPDVFRQTLSLCLLSLILLAGQGGDAGEAVAPFPAPGKWRGRFANEFQERGTLTIDLEKKRGAYSGISHSASDDGTQGPPITITGGKKVGGDFVLTGELSIPLEGEDSVPGRFVLTGAADGNDWSGTFRIEAEDGSFGIDGEFELRRGGGSNPTVAPQDLDAYGVDFALREFHDPQMNNELAVTIAVPVGWQFKEPGAIQWLPVTYGDPARIFYVLTGPKDEATGMFLSRQAYRYDFGIERLFALTLQQQAQQRQRIQNIARQTGMPVPMLEQPALDYRENTVDEGVIVKKPLSAEAFIQNLLAQDQGISRVQIAKSWKPESVVEGLEKVLPEMNRQISAMTPRGAAASRFTADTAVVEFTCFRDGKQYEQQMAAVIMYMHMESPANRITGAADEVVYWMVSPLVSVYALKGKLKEHELELAAIMGNSRVNPVWSAKVEYLVSETLRIISERKLKDQAEIQRTMNDTFDHISKTRREVFQNRQDTMSKVAQGMTDVITGTDRVRGDDGKIYAVPTGVLPERKVPWAW